MTRKDKNAIYKNKLLRGPRCKQCNSVVRPEGKRYWCTICEEMVDIKK